MKAIASALIALFFLKFADMINSKYLWAKGLCVGISFVFIIAAFILVPIE